MNILPTSLPGVLLFEPTVHGDTRGFFVETFRATWLHDAGLSIHLVQDNQSRSHRGVLRGLHFQRTNPQGKLVRVSRGSIFDVALDIRTGSPTFGQWSGAVLDDVRHLQMYIPPGFAHGFVVLSDIADVCYRCSEYYHPSSEIGISWNDPDIGIRWPTEISQPVMSPRDRRFPNLKDIPASDLPTWETSR